MSYLHKAVLVVIFSTFTLYGCETTTHAQEGQVIGTVIGGAVGAQVGDGYGNTTATILGALAGGMIGQHIGQSMDDTDRMLAAQTLNDNRTGETRTWVNPDTGYRYTFTPTRTYEEASVPCREFRLDATIGDRSDQDVYGTACLQADGSWLVN
jgi:surface antigen